VQPWKPNSRETKSEQLKGLPKELIRGMVYNHNRANANTAQLHETSATLQTMVELLVKGCVLDREMFEERRIEAAENLRQHYIKQGMAVAMQEFGGSKYHLQSGAEVDCINLVQLCEAACCRTPGTLKRGCVSIISFIDSYHSMKYSHV